MSALDMSLHMEHFAVSHLGGCLLLKSTIFKIGEGSFADNNWIENLLAERFVSKDCIFGLAENFPSSSLSLAWYTGLQSVRAIAGLFVTFCCGVLLYLDDIVFA